MLKIVDTVKREREHNSNELKFIYNNKNIIESNRLRIDFTKIKMT